MDENNAQNSTSEIQVPILGGNNDRWRRNTSGWSPGGTLSFRNASKKWWGKYGTNLQNQPDKLRRIYYADEGKLLVQPDQSGAEALIVSYLGPAGTYRQLFQYGINPHCHLGLHLFTNYWQDNTPHDARFLTTLSIPDLASNPEWPKLAKVIKSSDGWESKKRFYYFSKKTGHAHNYDMRANTFQLSILKESGGEVCLTKHQAEAFLEGRTSVLPEIPIWHNTVREQVKATRCIRNLFGFPRWFNGPLNEKTFKDAYAQCPQSTVGCISNFAFVAVQKFIEDSGVNWDLLNNCHDSIMFQVPLDEVELAVKVAKAAMEMDLVAPDGTPFKMKSEVSVGFNWSKFSDSCINCKAHKDKCNCGKYQPENIDGMKEWKVAA